MLGSRGRKLVVDAKGRQLNAQRSQILTREALLMLGNDGSSLSDFLEEPQQSIGCFLRFGLEGSSLLLVQFSFLLES